MLFHSGRTYSLDHLDINAKLDLILKELQDLNLRVEGLESKSNEETLENRKTCRESHNVRIRDKSTSRLKINEDDIIRRIKIDLLTFNCILDRKNFYDWMADLDYYFDWYRFTEENKTQFARMRLTRSARIYWTSTERAHKAWGSHRVLGGNETET